MMSRRSRVGVMLTLVLMSGITASYASDQPTSKSGSDDTAEHQLFPFISQYCSQCHGEEKPMAELILTKHTDEFAVQSNRKVWENVVQMLTTHEMPPKDHPQPPPGEVDDACRAIREILARVDCGTAGALATAGRVTMRRLNRNEYNNTIRDLLGVQFQPADDFPADDVGYGFDNIGDVLNFSPLLAEKYLIAAETILEESIVIIDPPSRTKSQVGQIRPQSVSSKSEQSGFITLEEGDYLIRANVGADQVGNEFAKAQIRVTNPETKEVTESSVFTIEGSKDKPSTIEMSIHVKQKGNYRLGVLFVNPFDTPNDQEVDFGDELARLMQTLKEQEILAERGQGMESRRAARQKADEVKASLKLMGIDLRTLYVHNIATDGPINPPAPTKPDRFLKLMAHADGLEHRAAAREIVKRFASKAFRRPAEDVEVEQCLAIYDLVANQNQRFELCIRAALMRVLVSPHFLFRIELDPAHARPDEAYAINEYELASRLSYFLWNSTPDDELLTLAAGNRLRIDLDAQVARMLQDSKSTSFIENFSEQWLALRKLDLSSPDPQMFPTFTPELRQAMIRESLLFFEAIIRDDHRITDLLTADFTFVNEGLAKHYGMSGVSGKKFVRAAAPPHRGGILTQASILTLTSNATRTSPVKRGKFVLEQILNTPPPPPPDDVPPLEEGQALTGSLRQIMEQHRANATCASCHSKMDPLGFAFENFDAVGVWRDREGEHVVDATGELPNGETFNGPEGLKKVMLQREKLFVRCLTEKMLTYALGRGLEYYDRCTVDKIVEALEKNDLKFSTLLIEIIKSDPFQLRTTAKATPNGESP